AHGRALRGGGRRAGARAPVASVGARGPRDRPSARRRARTGRRNDRRRGRGQADEAFAAAAAAAAQPDIRSLALSERSLLAAGHDDDLAEALALEARSLVEEGQLDGYATSALDLAATARALLRHGQWDEARRQLTVANRLGGGRAHSPPPLPP